MPGIWNKETYEASVSSRCWWYTAWDHGWGRCAQYGSSDLSGDEDLRQIVAMEEEMGPVPEWACRIVEGPVNFLPACGHYRFPQAYLEAVDAIGSEIPPAFIHGCYTCDSARKMQMEDYLLCLDAWFAGAAPEDVAVELSSRQLSRAEGFIHASPW